MRAIPDTPGAGLSIMMLAMLLAPGMDVFAKLLTQTTSPGQVTLGRFLVQTGLLVPLVLMTGQWSAPRRAHVLAGFFLAIALVSINTAFSVMPIVNAIAIFFVEPLILTVLSVLILGERIGWRRVVAVVVGLFGAMIVIRPNWAAFGPTSVLPVLTALCFAAYLLVTKVMAAGRNKLALQFWSGIFALLFLALFTAVGDRAGLAIAALRVPAIGELWLYSAMGGLAVLTHQMIVHALARADASLAAPLQYLEIVSGTLLGWWVFSDFPDPLTWLGAIIIIGAGIYVFYRERRVQREVA